MKRRIALIFFFTAVAARTAGAGTPPAGFADAELFGAAEPTALGYEPGSGNAFALEKGNGQTGTARVLRRALAGGAVTTALTLSCVDPDGERGLLGIAFDPDYLQSAETRWVYLYYTRSSPSSGTCALATTGSRNRVARFKEAGGVLSGEQVLLEGPVLGAINHNGGTLRFAPDKTLFVSMGDNDTDADALPKSRDLSDLRGKILRIARDGAIPNDNPFVGQAGKRGEIWAWGFRNPFRFSIDSATGTPWIADVGENTWEEIDRGVAGADYGYPCYEGNAPFRTCNPPSAGPTFPELVYAHHFTPWPYTGSAITGGPVYRNGNFPASYSGRLFYADYGDHWIRSALVGAGGTLSDVQLFMSDGGGVVDMVQAPNGCLGYVDIIGGSIRETCYTAGANTAPAVVATATPTSGPAPLTVQFTGSDSSDGDGDTLVYSWTFGDGGSSSAADPTHQYSAGVYDARLSIDDQQGSANSVAVSPPIRIVAGNQPPTPSIAEPGSGAHFNAGDTIAYSGSATDPEDGVLPASGLSWTIVFHHDLHTHPFAGPIAGAASGSFVIPTTGEDATNVWYRIHLTATDSGAPAGEAAKLSSSTYVDVLPNIATITVDARPAGEGLAVSFNGTQAVAPASFDSVVNFPRAIAAPSPQTANGRTWMFLYWGDAVGNPRTIATPPVDTTYTAFFRCTSNCAGLRDQDGDGFDGASVGGGDCDDLDPTVFPGAPELCDGKDNDCDLVVPGNEIDADQDGLRICQADCDDTRASVYPGAPQRCDGVNNDCSDPGWPAVSADEADVDQDGYRVCQGDCDDTRASVYPGATPRCDGVNYDCNDPAWPAPPANEVDADQDGFRICEEDCDDTRASVFPGAPQRCDGVNNDCGDPAWPVAPADEADTDQDGYRICGGDCNDSDPTVYAGAPDLCDGKDNDCNLAVDDATCADFGGTDGAMNGFDLGLLGRYFGLCSASVPSEPWAPVEFSKDGCLDGVDLAVMASVWGCSGTAPLCP